MRYPAFEINRAIGFTHVEQIEQDLFRVQIIPYVIERHDDHNQSAKQVDGLYTAVRG